MRVNVSYSIRVRVARRFLAEPSRNPRAHVILSICRYSPATDCQMTLVFVCYTPANTSKKHTSFPRAQLRVRSSREGLRKGGGAAGPIQEWPGGIELEGGLEPPRGLRLTWDTKIQADSDPPRCRQTSDQKARGGNARHSILLSQLNIFSIFFRQTWSKRNQPQGKRTPRKHHFCCRAFS